eukprot:CAMPEP_0169463874 /NCGR_PEP_ID=MMETSP1042-20121227/20348_1 /TAXON_ID=464988 /ORGANISM="Hemiselmis andersenii, Strain CCMP1180" /LENGTH=1709 /DNA_ID=CAMNT_0009576651 /DNA_START=1 /DNA_END=5130 /DNA_ORIENTATION=+
MAVAISAACCFAAAGPKEGEERRQIAIGSGAVEDTLGDNEWIRNGEILGPGSIPVDGTYWNNRGQLYDNFGNHKFGADYFAEGQKQGTGTAQPGVNLAYTYADIANLKIINKDTEANFWSGQALVGDGWSASIPGRPWVRQSVPFTCATNPYKECPHGDDTERCKAEGCEFGRRLGKPMIMPNGGSFNSTVLVTIEVGGLERKPSKLPSAPIVPMTSFQNGVCKAACEGKPTYPACLDKLLPQNGVYGTEMLGGYMRKDIQGNPCKDATKLNRKFESLCRCNVAKIICEEGEAFCLVRKEKCLAVVDLPCDGPSDNTTCGPPEQGGVCALGTWYETDVCADDLTPTYPDAEYLDGDNVQLVNSECRGVVCTDHTQCVHVYYTVDGSEPTRSSRLYTGPFVVDTTIPKTNTVTQKEPFVNITIRAIAVQEGNLDSETGISNTFYIKDFEIDTGKGRMWTWGHNTRGQLGLGDGLYNDDARFPNEVPGAPGLVLPEFCFDLITEELLPERNCDPSRWVLTNPQAMLFNSRFVLPPEPAIVNVAAGAYHTVGIDEDGKLLAWGWNGYGQLGSPTNMPTYGLPSHPTDNTQRNLPTAALFVDTTAEQARFIHVAAGTFHSGAIDTEGYAYLWGVNFQGQLCSGSVSNINYPTRIVSMPTDEQGNVIPGARWVMLALGQEHTILLASTGQVYACGSNRVNQLGRARFVQDTGDGQLSSCLQDKTPFGCPTIYNVRWDRPVLCLGEDDVPRSGLDVPMTRVVKIVAGAYHNLALTADGVVYSWGDNRMNQLGQGPLVYRGPHCCARKVPFYVFNEYADLQPDGGPGGLLPGTREPDWPWPGYKVLDIAAGSHFSVAIVVNVTGEGCTLEGEQSGHRCVTQDMHNGITTQEWDIPRNVDILSDHFRTDAFDFSAAIGCNCAGKLHLPGGRAGCDIHAYTSIQEMQGGAYCIDTGLTGNATDTQYPCHYRLVGKCVNGRECSSTFDCTSSNANAECDRIIRTCTTYCSCADRSCPASPTDTRVPGFGETYSFADSPFARFSKKGMSCGCTPSYETMACKNFREFRVQGALPDCCFNTLANAPVPNIRFSKVMWEEFHKQNNLVGPAAVYGTCTTGDVCEPADVASCFSTNCQYQNTTTLTSVGIQTDDGHPTHKIGHKQTCTCYKQGRCIGGNAPGAQCLKATESVQCAGIPPGRCSVGGNYFDIGGGGAPIFYGDCECRNATRYEWENFRWEATDNANSTRQNRTVLGLPEYVVIRLTFWNSNPCPYYNEKQWTGPDCRLVKLPFPKFVFGWGDTRAGQLGISLDSTPEKLTPPNDQPQNVPRPRGLPSLNKIDMVAISAGAFHAAIISEPQPHNFTVCNLSKVSPLGRGAPIDKGGEGPESVLGEPFRCEGRNLYTFGSNNNGEMGIGIVTENQAVDCVSVGGVRVPCENMGGFLRAQRVNSFFGRNISHVTLGYKHSVILLGDCPLSSLDRCGVCFGENVDCLGCNGLTNDKTKLDWCGVCGGDNSTCSGCQMRKSCEAPGEECLDKNGGSIACSPIESYNPCHQGRKLGTPCCLDARGLPATPLTSDPALKTQGEAPGNGPVPCSHFGAYRWRDVPRAGRNFCGLMYDECDVCDGDHTRCNDCMGVPNGKQTNDLCNLCGGMATVCVGCDGQPEPDENIRAKYDACELCRGDNTTCSIMLMAFNSASSPVASLALTVLFAAVSLVGVMLQERL